MPIECHWAHLWAQLLQRTTIRRTALKTVGQPNVDGVPLLSVDCGPATVGIVVTSQHWRALGRAIYAKCRWLFLQPERFQRPLCRAIRPVNENRTKEINAAINTRHWTQHTRAWNKKTTLLHTQLLAACYYLSAFCLNLLYYICSFAMLRIPKASTRTFIKWLYIFVLYSICLKSSIKCDRFHLRVGFTVDQLVFLVACKLNNLLKRQSSLNQTLQKDSYQRASFAQNYTKKSTNVAIARPKRWLFV